MGNLCALLQNMKTNAFTVCSSVFQSSILHLNVSYPHVSLNIVADHKVSQDAVGGDLGLLDDVGAEGDLADVLFVFDRGAGGRVEPG